MKKALTNQDTVKMIARRWFQKSYGNTYHSVQVYVNDELIGSNPFAYGYGDHFICTGTKLLIDNGYDLKDNYALYGNQEVTLITRVTDVDRKKDL